MKCKTSIERNVNVSLEVLFSKLYNVNEKMFSVQV